MFKVLVDGCNLWYKAYIVSSKWSPEDPGAPVKLFSNMLYKITSRYRKEHVTVCWDKGKGGRLEIDPDYKGTRIKNNDVWESLHYAQTLLSALGVPQAHVDGYEADDVIGSLSQTYCKDYDVLIHSHDQDFYQLLAPRIFVVHPAKSGKFAKPEKRVGLDDILDEYITSADKLLLLKAFKGDKSDNLPKIDISFTKKFKKSLMPLIRDCSSVEEIYENLDQVDKSYKERMLAFRDRAIKNYRLAKIETSLEVSPTILEMNPTLVSAIEVDLGLTPIDLDLWKDIPLEFENTLF